MVFAFVNYGARASDLNCLVRSAYMQGVNDSVDALIRSGCEIKPTATYTATEQIMFNQDGAKRGAPPLEDILVFKITDNGVGFNDANMESFRTLDTAYKACLGCRGVDR